MELDRPLAETAADYIRIEMQNRRNRRSEYSLRAFARDLNLSPSTLSEILSGKVGISPQKSQDLAKRLKLAEPHDEHFCDLVSSKFSRNLKAKKEASLRVTSRLRSTNSHLSLEKFKLVADWHHNAILELIDLHPKYHSFEALAKALAIHKKTVKESIERLVLLGELKLEGRTWSTASDVSYVGEKIPSDAIKSYHKQVIEKAQEALFQQPLEKREFQTSFFPIDPADIENFKQDLNRMRKELLKKYRHKPGRSKVYALSIQLFDLMNG